jgi:GH25 family lysozyme M1 (1,4-beta-N-acetylmuramidase)
MSADYRHSGVGWPTGAADLSAVFSLPSPNLLMLATEGRYHYDEAVRAGKRCLWRAVPRLGKRPAELKWSPARFMTEALNLTDEPTLPIRDFVFGNELDLAPERGDNEDDWSNLENRYALIGGWAYSLIPMLRQALPGARLHWPAFTPDHDAIMWVDHWRASADLCDVIDFHAYDSLAHIQNAYHDYRNEFPTQPLALTEWHCKGDLDEERRVLQWLAETMAVDPMFEAAYFFIWRWWDHPGWWDDSWDIEHTPARLALFRDPPTAAIAEPPPPPMPDPPPPDTEPIMPETSPGIDVSNNNGHIDWDAVAAAGIEWGYAKVSEGVDFVDRFFPENWTAMKEHGLVRGGYHFARPSENGAVAEAMFFLDCLEAAGGLQAGDFIVLDFEDERAVGDLGPWALQWLSYVESRVGFKPMVYSGAWIINQHNLAAYPALGEYGLILAAYQGSQPPTPAPWSLMAAWQNDDHTGVPGVAGDHDVFFGSVEQLRKYGKPAGTEPSEPPATVYAVGEGVLAAMAEHGDQPGSDEVYPNPFWSETMSTNGTYYRWLKATGQTFRYPAA